MENKKDIFDLLSVHEDGYSNLLKHLFYKYENFKYSFLELLFDKEDLKKGEEWTFETRRPFTYVNEINENKRIIPDILIYNRDHLCLIEVKEFAGEGEIQTERYYRYLKVIEENLGLKNINEKNKRLYYLTLNGKEPYCDKFNSMPWQDIKPCLESISRADHTDVDAFLIKDLIERIISIEGKPGKLTDRWDQAVYGPLWNQANNFHKTLKQAFTEEFESTCWADFKRTENAYTYSAQFYKPEWVGKKLEKTCEEEEQYCYHIHYEFEWDPEKKTLCRRLDYELNPYASKKEINGYEKDLRPCAKNASKIRASIAREVRKKWRNKHSKNGLSINRHITENLMTFCYGEKNEETIDEKETVENVLGIVQNFCKECDEIVSMILDQINSFSLEDREKALKQAN